MLKQTTYLRITVLLIMSFSLLVSGLIPASAQTPFRVAILVVDDFGSVDLSTVSADPDVNCAVNLESQAYIARGVSADPIPVSHGELVVAELEDLLEETGMTGTIELVEVDIQGVTTDVAAGLIAAALDSTSADFYVVNMSFAIIPCEFIQAFADFQGQLMDAKVAKDANRHRGLFQRAVIFYDDTVFPVMSQRAQSETDFDPIQTLLAARSANVIPVASAGNFALDYPFWPGAWGQVISASASTGEGFYAPSAWDDKKDTPLLDGETEQPNQKKRISNYGEVMLPGEYTSESGVVSGTSFAAPRLSVVMALYVAQVGGAFCRNDDGNPALAYGDWDNLTLEQAVNEYCPDMAAYLP